MRIPNLLSAGLTSATRNNLVMQVTKAKTTFSMALWATARNDGRADDEEKKVRGFTFQTTKSVLAEPGHRAASANLCVDWDAVGCFTSHLDGKETWPKISALRFDDQPDRRAAHAGLRVAHLGTSSVRYEIGLFRDEQENAAAQGHFVHVCVDRSTSRPVPLPQRLRSALTPLIASSPEKS